MPAVAIITSISRDHTAILGETHAEIAAEKAGIVKPGVPVVSSPQHKDALSVIEAACRQAAVPLTLVGRDWTWEICEFTLDRHSDGAQTFLVYHGQELVGKFHIPLLGSYQVVNATTAIAALAELRSEGVSIPIPAIQNGLAHVQWPGRFEILGQAPYLVADSAHNGDSARKLIEALSRFLDFERLTVVLGASTDHVTPGLLEALLVQADRAIATKTRHPRAASPPWIRDQAAELGFEMEISPSVPEALDMALASAGPKDLICCTGSVFVAAETRMAWFARQGVTLPAADPA
jgi:dihydrofolate synthase/folylpolyglutamate synthase